MMRAVQRAARAAALGASLIAFAACSPAQQSTSSAEQAAPHSTPSRTGYADVEGGRIYYQVHGDLTSRRTPLLVLHGSFMSGDAMQPFIDAFAQSRPVIAIDARGHGRTGDLEGGVTYPQMADDAVAVLTALNVPSADVFGYSMGGTTAIVLAIRHPDRVGKQIVLSGASARNGWYPEVLQAIEGITPEVFRNTPIYTEYQRLSPTPDRFDTFVEEVTGLEVQNYDSAPEAIRGIDDKTMIIVGDADAVDLDHALELFKLRGGGDRQAAAQGMLTAAPRARLAILPATSHIGMMAEAGRVAELARPFLDDQAPPPPEGFFGGSEEQSGGG